MSDSETSKNQPAVANDSAVRSGEGTQGSAGGEPAHILLLADLFFASKVRAVAAALGARIVMAKDAARLRAIAQVQTPRLVLVDLELRGMDLPALIRELKSSPQLAGTTVIGFASHMNADAIAAARDAGADRVLARSAFTQLLPALIGDALR